MDFSIAVRKKYELVRYKFNLTPVDHVMLADGYDIPIYNRKSFDKIHGSFDVSYQPQIFVVDDLFVKEIFMTKIDRLHLSNMQKLLVFHGMDSGKEWIQVDYPNRSVRRLLEELEEKYPVDGLAVCNPGKYRLSQCGDLNKYTYPIGDSVISVSVATFSLGIAIHPNKEDEWINIKGQKEQMDIRANDMKM